MSKKKLNRLSIWFDEKVRYKTFRTCWRCHKKFRQWLPKRNHDTGDCRPCAMEMYSQAQISLQRKKENMDKEQLKQRIKELESEVKLLRTPIGCSSAVVN